MTTLTLAAINARPDPNNDLLTIVVPDGTCLSVNDGDASYAEAYPGVNTGSLAQVGGAAFWTPSPDVRWAAIASAQIVVVARYLSGSDVRLQAGWTDPAYLTNSRAYAPYTFSPGPLPPPPVLTAGYATYTATLPIVGMLAIGGPTLSGIVGYCAVDDVAGDSARFTYVGIVVTGTLEPSGGPNGDPKIELATVALARAAATVQPQVSRDPEPLP